MTETYTEEEQPAVTVGMKDTVLIHNIGSKGDGITKINGMVVIVPDTKVNDCVDIEITKVCERFAFAKKV